MSYHNEIMNIQPDVQDSVDHVSKILYKAGHRDARHAAAEIALQSDRDIEDLVQCVYELREALCDAYLDSEDNTKRSKALVSSTDLLQRIGK